MLGSSLASPLATLGPANCFRHSAGDSLTCTSVLPLSLNLSYHGVAGGVRTSRGPRNKWIVVCSPTQVETSGDEPKTWEECKEALSRFDFSVEEQDKILGKAFGHIHSPYWTEERVKENPKVEALNHVLEFLRSLGLSDEDLHKVLKKFPEVLGCSLEEEMKPNIGILENQWGITAPFGSSEWMYGSRSLRTQGNDDALATLADLAPPPQKLKPIRCVVKPPSEDRQHPLDILAGSLDRLPPEMGFLGDGGCFEAPLGSKIADVEESGQLTRGFSKDEVEMEVRGRVSRRDGVSLSSSADSDSDSSQGGRKGKRKRKTREKMEHFVEKLVGSMMKRQEKMHNQLIKVMEKMEHERIRSEEAWRQQEIERMKQNEEARMREMSRSSSIISFIKSVIGEEEDIEMPNLTIPLPKQCESAHQRQGDDVKFVFPSGRRWPHEEVQALIDSRSQVEEKTGFHRVAIWDDVSAKMKERGYERSAKKCKEKWENMNKYYKRVVEGKKTQPEHSKTRSYFEKLGKLYKTNSVVEKEE